MYEFEGIFWLKLLIILFVFFIASYLIDLVARKILKLPRRKFFSYNHINKVHERIDWCIRIAFMFLLFIAFIINYAYKLWYLQPYFVLLLFITVSGLTRALMEWKYLDNRKESLFTFLQLGFLLLLFSGIVWIATTSWLG
ncbi:DUF4181 domain-containing protein [Bacillus sp. 522_BSPC]|uniref:DUF4181 domain-containing protein n=1 Tax=Bacillus sp. 522_BSPC TaxID=1579338 RepID=UPI0004E0C002|nr:DUF4181 domain-containing protein [Bacillus sp. 522_BSPC]